MLTKTQTPLALRLRRGDTTDPYVFITETNRQISDGGVLVLKEFPVNDAEGYLLEIEGAIIVATLTERAELTGLEVGDRVFVQDAGDGNWAQYVITAITDGNGDTSSFEFINTDNPSPVAVNVFMIVNEESTLFTEITDPSATLIDLQYRVDYEFGLLHFNPDLYGALSVERVTYAGRGAYYIAASRVYNDENYTADENDEFTTLQDVLNSVQAIAVDDTITVNYDEAASVEVTGTSFTFRIPRGAPFVIAAEYASVADLSSETPTVIPSNYTPVLFDLVIINTGSVENEENAQLYIYDEQGSFGGFTFVSDLSGATGPKRDIQWKSESTGLASDRFILRWEDTEYNDWDTDSETDLALTPSWQGTELTIARSDGVTASYDLGITPSWDNTVLTLSPNDGSTDAIYDLGITPSFNGSTLILSPNDGSADVTYDIGFALTQNGSEIIFTPNEIGNAVSYDIGFIPSFNADGRLTITPNDNTITPIFYDLGWSAAFNGTTLTITPDNGDPAVAIDLGLTPTWDSNGTLTVTPNSGGAPVSYDLGWEAIFNNTTLTFTPDAAGSTPINSDLGVTPTWQGSELTITPNYSGAPGVSADLGLEYTWGGTGLTDTTLTIQDKIGGSAISQELGTYAEWGDGDGATITSVRFENGDGTYTNYQELGLDAVFNGTELTITTPDGALPAVDLQADSPIITASATSVAFTGSAAVVVTEPTPNTFNLDFDIPVGEPLTINVVYATISDMNSNTTPTPVGYTPALFDLAVIQSPEGAENEDNAKLYVYNGSAWTFVSDLSGAKGETGDIGPIGPMPDHQWVGTSLQFQLPGGGYGTLVDLKGDGALDSDIVNTSTLGDLNTLANQKIVNEHFESEKMSVTGATMTGDLTIDNADFQVLDSAGTSILSVDVNASKAYVGANEVAALNSFVAGVKETNANNNIAFWSGTQAEYDLIATPDANTIYFITDN